MGNDPITPNNAFERAAAQHRAGKLADAETLYREVLQGDPRHAGALHRLGIIALQVGQPDTGAAFLQQAVAIDDARPDFWSDFGNALQTCGKLDDAVAAYRRAIKLDPGFAAAWYNLGNAFNRLERPKDALAAFDTVIATHPDHANALCNRGSLFEAQGQTAAATADFQAALRHQPTHTLARANLGGVLIAAGKVDEAVSLLRDGLAATPDDARLLNNLGVALHHRGEAREAADLLGRAVAIAPGLTDAAFNLGNALHTLDQGAEAVEAYRRAVEARPDFAAAWTGLGVVLEASGDISGAIAAHERAIACAPDLAEAHLNHAVALLLSGDFKAGWRELEWRWREKQNAAAAFVTAMPEWEGGPLDGQTILLHAEQGLGDTIQFVRYAPLVTARGGRVILQCQHGMAKLLSTVAGVETIVEQGEPIPPFDCHAPLMSLPRLFATDAATIPADTPYLSADAGRTRRWAGRLGEGSLKIGLCWQGRPQNLRDRHRSFPADLFAPLAAIDGVRLFALQKSDGEAASAPEFPIVDLGAGLDPGGERFVDTAAVMAGLDLIISADTSVAHLAGALGRPVWVPLAFAPDWRWLCERTDSPWYPTMRLFRQPTQGDWPAVFAAIGQEVAKLRV